MSHSAWSTAPVICANGPGLAALDRHPPRAVARAARARARDRRRARRSSSGAKRLVDEARAMLGADLREVAEHLAPAPRAVARGDAQEHGGPVRHRAERVRDGLGDRRAEHPAFDLFDARLPWTCFFEWNSASLIRGYTPRGAHHGTHWHASYGRPSRRSHSSRRRTRPRRPGRPSRSGSSCRSRRAAPSTSTRASCSSRCPRCWDRRSSSRTRPARAAWSAPRWSRSRRRTATRCCSATSRRSRSTSASIRRCPTIR